jgi:hypothetical protein
MDPIIHTVAHRNQVLFVKQRLADVAATFETLAELRELNAQAIGAVRHQRGEVAAQRAAENFMSDAALARMLLEPLSGTELGKLIRTHGAQTIDQYPNDATFPRNPPPKAA